MAGPELALIGAGVGAMLSPRDPLKGAVLGAIGGYAGGSAIGSAGAGGAAVGEGLSAGMNTVNLAGVGGAAGDVSLASAYTGPASQIASKSLTMAPITNAVAVPASEAAITGAVQPAYAGVGAPGNVLTGGSAASSFANASTKDKLNLAMKAQQLASRPQPTAMSPQQMKRPGGGQVNSASPIMSLLDTPGSMDLERRRRMSLMGGRPMSLLG